MILITTAKTTSPITRAPKPWNGAAHGVVIYTSAPAFSGSPPPPEKIRRATALANITS